MNGRKSRWWWSTVLLLWEQPPTSLFLNTDDVCRKGLCVSESVPVATWWQCREFQRHPHTEDQETTNDANDVGDDKTIWWFESIYPDSLYSFSEAHCRRVPHQTRQINALYITNILFSAGLFNLYCNFITCSFRCCAVTQRGEWDFLIFFFIKNYVISYPACVGCRGMLASPLDVWQWVLELGPGCLDVGPMWGRCEAHLVSPSGAFVAFTPSTAKMPWQNWSFVPADWDTEDSEDARTAVGVVRYLTKGNKLKIVPAPPHQHIQRIYFLIIISRFLPSAVLFCDY